MKREQVERHRWAEVTTYIVPAYKLERTVNAMKQHHVVAGWNGEVTIMQDINRERWLWGFRLSKVGDKHNVRTANGHAATLEEAQVQAEEALFGY